MQIRREGLCLLVFLTFMKAKYGLEVHIRAFAVGFFLCVYLRSAPLDPLPYMMLLGSKQALETDKF